LRATRRGGTGPLSSTALLREDPTPPAARAATLALHSLSARLAERIDPLRWGDCVLYDPEEVFRWWKWRGTKGVAGVVAMGNGVGVTNGTSNVPSGIDDRFARCAANVDALAVLVVCSPPSILDSAATTIVSNDLISPPNVLIALDPAEQGGSSIAGVASLSLSFLALVDSFRTILRDFAVTPEGGCGRFLVGPGA
jgi:hypothetical protein